jgi:hypothetical protein
MLAGAPIGWLARPSPARAQATPALQSPADSGCTYLRCSLWLDGGRVRQGAHGDVVARRGFFRPLGVVRLVTGDSARHYATQYERNARRASLVSFTALTLVIAGLVVGLSGDCDTIPTPFGDTTCPDDASGPIAGSLLLGGFTLNFVSITISIRGHRSLVRALWWHNSQYAR